MKIAVYACFKNEIDNVDAWVASTWGADVLSILDTGSTDGTVEALKHEGVEVHQASIRPWRFDTGFNTALAMVPEDVDLCIQLSGDERLSEGWRDAIDAVVPSKLTHPTQLTYLYEFSPSFSFHQDRIHSRFGYVWRYPFHEGLYPIGCKEDRIHVPGLTISQAQNLAVDRSTRDNTLAEVALQEFPDDPRMIFYVGRQFMYAGDYLRAEQILKRYEPMMKRRGLVHKVESEWCALALDTCRGKLHGK